jgi:hypothetical protein
MKMAFPNFTDVAGAVVLLFLADSSPAPSPPPPPPTVRYYFRATLPFLH